MKSVINKNKILILEFKNAIVFSEWNKNKSRDKIWNEKKKKYFDRGGTKKMVGFSKYEMPFLENTLYDRHVMNVLQVLAGKRPVPKYRKSQAFFDDEIKSMAENSFIEVTECRKELLMTRKNFYNSNATYKSLFFLDGKYFEIDGGEMYLKRLKRFLGTDLYDKFISLGTKYNNGEKIKCKEGIELLNRNNKKQDVIDFMNKLSENKKTSLKALISSDKNKYVSYGSNDSNIGKYISLAVNNGIEKNVNILSGFIYIKIKESQLNMFRNGCGIATLFDGGLVSIYSVEDDFSSILLNAEKNKKDEVKYVFDEY
jgi:predicted transcriptional regulator YdeE